MKDLDRDKLSQLIISLRNSRDLSRDEMGRLLKVSGKTIKRWEKGETLPTMVDIIHICNEFNISLEEVFEGQKNLDREVDRKLSKVNLGMESISDNISDLKAQFVMMREESVNNQTDKEREDLTWLWLLIIHLAATTIGFLSYCMSIVGPYEALISSNIYVLAICYVLHKKRNDMKCLRLFLLYAVVLEVNFLLNYVFFADMPVEVPGVINNIELLAINGGMYGFCIFDYYHTEPLLLISVIVYTGWILYCGYYLIKNNVRKGSK
jgi:DNA-binding XRE family transcriptional regulator